MGKLQWESKNAAEVCRLKSMVTCIGRTNRAAQIIQQRIPLSPKYEDAEIQAINIEPQANEALSLW